MSPRANPRFTELTIDQLTIDDEPSFAHVALHADLKEVLRRAHYRFRVLPDEQAGRWDRALLLNLSYWGSDGGGDVLADDHLAADVVAHCAWHHLAAQALAEPSGAPPPAAALFLGEAIASAYDIYLVGRLLGVARESSFLETQVPAMTAVAEAAGVSDEQFEALLLGVADDPARAFEDLRALLFDAMTALLSCRSAEEGLSALTALEERRFGCLLHHYELSTWVLYARAYGGPDEGSRAAGLDRSLREAESSLDLLTSAWVRPALA